jgi:DNA-binding NarL/FixJ family response regulator
MSDAARTILIVTDDPIFSGEVAELMLRAGVRKVRFAGSHEALDLTRAIAPDLVLLHMPSGQMELGWGCYTMLRADATTAAIPVLMYAPPCELERAVGEAALAPPLVSTDWLPAQVSMLVGGSARSRMRADDDVAERFPTGRDDL